MLKVHTGLDRKPACDRCMIITYAASANLLTILLHLIAESVQPARLVKQGHEHTVKDIFPTVRNNEYAPTLEGSVQSNASQWCQQLVEEGRQLGDLLWNRVRKTADRQAKATQRALTAQLTNDLSGHISL